jgi:hypothetical protein
MDSPDPCPDERRKSFRCCVTAPQQAAELIVGRRRIAVRVTNESSGGLAVVVDGDPGVRVDDLAELLTSAGQSVVRVAHIAPYADVSTGDGSLCLGLTRLQELPPKSLRACPPDDGRAGCAAALATTSGAWHRIRGVILAIVLATAVMATLAALIRWNHPVVQRFLKAQSYSASNAI